jgi:hypothetical protein
VPGLKLYKHYYFELSVNNDRYLRLYFEELFDTSRLRDFETSRLRDFETSRLRDFETSRLRDFEGRESEMVTRQWLYFTEDIIREICTSYKEQYIGSYDQ